MEGAPVFPLLQNYQAASPPSAPVAPPRNGAAEEDNDGEPAVAMPFARTSSPDSASRMPPASTSGGGDDDDRLSDRLVYKMHKFSLYETASRYYVVGVDVSEKKYRILKIDRTTEGAELNMTDDKIVYSLKEMNLLLDTIDDGNRGTGGIRLRCTTWGLLGFIKFTGPYYMLLITKKAQSLWSAATTYTRLRARSLSHSPLVAPSLTLETPRSKGSWVSSTTLISPSPSTTATPTMSLAPSNTTSRGRGLRSQRGPCRPQTKISTPCLSGMTISCSQP